jgi:hypothetical protein
MKFLKIDYIILEIYPKGEKSSNDDDVDINDNSQFVNVAKIILEENLDILKGDLNEFIKVIKKLFNDKAEIIKNNLKENNNDNALQEFDKCFLDDNIIVKIDELITKYNIDDKNSKLLSVLLNITTIIDYIIVNVREPEKYNITRLFV